MRNQNSRSRWLIAPALFLVFCSKGPSPSPSGASNPILPGAAGDNGRVSSQADGDLKIGSGALELVRLRMDRQSSPGVSVLRQYANPGQTYAFNPGETIELWAEYPPSVPNPRFQVEWGDGTTDFTGCGSCLLTHVYRNNETYTVKASLDDRVSTTVTRTFTLQGRRETPAFLLQTVCGKPIPEVFAGGNCSANTAQFADWWCQLGGYARARSYTEIAPPTCCQSFKSLYYNGGPGAVLSSCGQVGGPANYGFDTTCTGVRDLLCES